MHAQAPVTLTLQRASGSGAEHGPNPPARPPLALLDVYFTRWSRRQTAVVLGCSGW